MSVLKPTAVQALPIAVFGPANRSRNTTLRITGTIENGYGDLITVAAARSERGLGKFAIVPMCGFFWDTSVGAQRFRLRMSNFATRSMTRLSIAATLTIALSGCQYPGQLSAFTSDGCSSFPDGPPNDPQRWRSCCYKHDQAYWLGGNAAERETADGELQVCIAEVENETLARAMWLGVRAGGSPYWPTTYRWAYGWPYTRGYRRVTDEERQTAESPILSTSPTVD